MADGSAPSASAVSAYLNKAFARSENAGGGHSSRGFKVRRGLGHWMPDRDWVVVEFEPGWNAAGNGQVHTHVTDRRAREQKMLNEYAEHLSERYDVSRNDEDGPDEWSCLLIRKKAVTL